MYRLLEGLLVLDLAGEPAQMAGRILAVLGARVVRIGEPAGDIRSRAWAAGKEVADEDALDELLASAAVVIDTPLHPLALAVDPARAPQAVWVSVTPFGLAGPRAGWRASDLGIMAASGNMYATGDPDRAPLRCREPTAYAHGGPEAVIAALTALASGRPQRVDVSLQETVLVANMGAAGRFARSQDRGRRAGANIGRTREIWPCADGWVSFGLRGGKARIPSLQTITRLIAEAGIDAPALSGRDWTTYNHNKVADEELRAIEEPIGRYFATRTMADLYAVACETNLMLAPINSPKEILSNEQLHSRQFFGPFAGFDQLPLSFVRVSARPSGHTPDRRAKTEEGPAWAGTNILEFGAGAAGPIATRYFAEQGATVIKVESRSRPDFLRTYSTQGLDASEMFDALNAGKLGITLNLKHPQGVELARRLAVDWADAVTENFAPRGMRSFGLDYERLSGDKPDLVMVSTCLMGQTGPHRDYPGFGGQGAALSGYNFLTGWPDRAPVGPFATITDSLSPRLAATALAAALLHRRRTGEGVYLDLSQVEAAAWTLTPWLLDYAVYGKIGRRDGNRSPDAVPHGAFPCQGQDRWVAVAAWDDAAWARLAAVIDLDDPRLASLDARRDRIDEVEAEVAAWTSSQTADEVAEALQAVDVEAVPVADFGDLFEDLQLAARHHFIALDHPVLGPGCYEHNGFRLSDAPSGYDRPSPTLGEHNELVLGDILGLSKAEQAQLAEDGALD